jgi:hypothetical protein
MKMLPAIYMGISFLSFSLSTAIADEPVRVKTAYGQNYAVSGMTYNWTTLQVKVKNIAYEKSVVLHYKDADSTWKDYPLPFIAHYNNYDLFGDGNAPVTSEFSIKFAAPGQEHWDNNNGANYKISTFKGVVAGNAMLKQATAHIGSEPGGGFVFTTSWIEGDIYVQNLSYNKRVGVHYTPDNGKHWFDAEATYAGKEKAVASDVDQVEIWRFRTPTLNLDSSSETFQLAVFYEIKEPGPDFGKKYWDNNFNQNYFLNKANDTKIE